LYIFAVQVFPFALRMIKAISPRNRLCILAPLLYFLSTVKPLLDLNYNFGIISAFARLAALVALPDFLQGLNVALLFLDYDWKKNPWGFQQKVLIFPILTAAVAPIVVKMAKITHSSFVDVSTVANFLVNFPGRGGMTTPTPYHLTILYFYFYFIFPHCVHLCLALVQSWPLAAFYFARDLLCSSWSSLDS
jgi:hypothetical protein